ncbi:MAG: nicotinate phosphoribosyltransferase, partial [Patescibacteria group bacterium]
MNWTTDGPIIKSRLDTDFYKFTMGQFVFRRYRDVEVTFSLINRSGAPLARFIREDDLRRELDSVIRTPPSNNTELNYLRGIINEDGDRIFREDYLQFFREMKLPPYNLERIGDDYKLDFSGPWSTVMHWEVPSLAIVNEPYCQGQLKKMSRFERDAVYADGV